MSDSQTTVVICNPASGSGDHVETVRSRADEAGYRFEMSDSADDLVELAAEHADAGVDCLAAAGGDGTINRVVQGVDRADAFDQVAVGVVPAGTGNNFAGQIGVTDLETAFDVLEDGERRQLDLGRADGSLFLNSCVAGLTAEASGETTPEMKDRYGSLAYVATTLRTAAGFSGLHLDIDTEADGITDWEGDVVTVLVGNARRFVPGEDTQADVEDGQFDVTIIEDAPTVDLLQEALADELFGRLSEHVTRLQATELAIEVEDRETSHFSLDGEIIERHQLSLTTDPSTITVPVGQTYDPDPDDRRRSG